MTQFFNYPEFVKAHPNRFKVELSYTAVSPERAPPINSQFANAQLDKHGKRTSAYVVQLPSVFSQIAAIQFQIWTTSQFGGFSVQNELGKGRRHKIQLQAGTSYIHYLNPEELEAIKHWCKLVCRDFAQTQAGVIGNLGDKGFLENS